LRFISTGCTLGFCFFLCFAEVFVFRKVIVIIYGVLVQFLNLWHDLFLCREHRAARASLFDGMDGLEEGGLRVSSSYSHETNDHDNERAVDSLQDRVIFLKRVSFLWDKG
jgi:hypothetical protein